MDDLLEGLAIAFGLMLVLEGLIYAAFPAGMQRMMDRMREMPPSSLRTAGVMALAAGVLIVWIARG